MTELTADLFVSLDGFAGAENAGPFFGHGGPDLDRWVHDQLDKPQLMVMGRVTFEVLAQISATAGDPAGRRMNELPKAVVSNTLTEPPGWGATRLVRGDLAAAIGELKRDSAVPLRTIGSLTLVRNLLRLGLVDLLRVTVFPLVLGPDGREPAFAGHARAGLDLAGTRVLDSRIVMLDYRPAG